MTDDYIDRETWALMTEESIKRVSIETWKTMTYDEMKNRVGIWVHENTVPRVLGEWGAFLDLVIQAIERSGIGTLSDGDVMRLDHCMKSERLDQFVTASMFGRMAWKDADESPNPVLQAHADKWAEHLHRNGDCGTDIECRWALTRKPPI